MISFGIPTIIYGSLFVKSFQRIKNLKLHNTFTKKQRQERYLDHINRALRKRREFVETLNETHQELKTDYHAVIKGDTFFDISFKQQLLVKINNLMFQQTNQGETEL